MGKGKRVKGNRARTSRPQIQQKLQTSSLLDVMQDGREYESIVGYNASSVDFKSELQRAVNELETARKRPLICYVANVVYPHGKQISIDPSDELPFAELVNAIDPAEKCIDVVIATPGGSAHQVGQFVDKLRPRFEHVAFLVPFKAMSAGTLWALSGDEIWMGPNSYLGPIDPQVPDKNGQMVPAQAILTLLSQIEEEGAKALADNRQPDWTDIRILDHMDPKEIGNAIAQSNYVVQLAADYLNDFKFRTWTKHTSTGKKVTAEERLKRANFIADKLCKHDHWKVHAHGISRRTLGDELQLKICDLESDPAVNRATRRIWALYYRLFEISNLSKIYLSSNYGLFRSRQEDVKT